MLWRRKRGSLDSETKIDGASPIGLGEDYFLLLSIACDTLPRLMMLHIIGELRT